MGAAREFYEELTSTQDRGLELARAGAPDGTRVVARRQSRGRGRGAHAWDSPEGGLYLSVVTHAPSAGFGLLPLAVGVELADRLESNWSIRSRLKWPNDVWVERPGLGVAKLAGILIDSVLGSDGRAVQVVGVGVNVHRPAAALPGPMTIPPVTLEELVRPCPSLEAVERMAAEGIVAARRDLGSSAAIAETVRRCRTRLFGVGRRARAESGPTGTIASLADDGALLLDVEGGTVALRSGDLTVEVG